MSDRVYGHGHNLAVTEKAHHLKADELLQRLEARGWPSCDLRTIGASGSLARHGVIGPGREAWEAFCSWADSRQMNHLILMAVHNPSLFTGGTPPPPEPAPKPRRARKTEADEDDELAKAMNEV
jgi:hypothetical protein